MAWVFTAMPTWSLRATQARESGSPPSQIRGYASSPSPLLLASGADSVRLVGKTAPRAHLTSARGDGTREGREEEREETTHSPACAEAIGSPLAGQSVQLRSAETSREVPIDHEAPSEQEGDGALGRCLSCLGRMRTRKPRRERAGHNAENLRPDQPSSKDATRTTVHDRGTPSRAEPDARCTVQAFVANAPAEVCSWGRTQEDQTRHGGTHDHAKKTVAGRSPGQGPQPRTRGRGREAQHESFHTRLVAVMKSLFYAGEEHLSTHS